MVKVSLGSLADATLILREDLYPALGITSKVWCDWVYGRSFPSPQQIDRMAEVFDVTPETVSAAVLAAQTGTVEFNLVLADRKKAWISARRREQQTEKERCPEYIKAKRREAFRKKLAECLIAVIVSIAASVITTLWLSGKF